MGSTTKYQLRIRKLTKITIIGNKKFALIIILIKIRDIFYNNQAIQIVHS